VQALAAALHENKTLKSLNIESNYISGQAIVNIVAAINVHQVMTEFRVSNQVGCVHHHQSVTDQCIGWYAAETSDSDSNVRLNPKPYSFTTFAQTVHLSQPEVNILQVMSTFKDMFPKPKTWVAR